MGAHEDVDLGHTVAGWTGTVVATVGSVGAGTALCAGWTPGIWLGLGMVAAAGALTWILHLVGWGKPSGPRSAHQWGWRVRDSSAGPGHDDCLGCRAALRSRKTAELTRPAAARPVRGLDPGAGGFWRGDWS